MSATVFNLNFYNNSNKITDIYFDGASSVVTENGVDCLKIISSGVLRATKDMIVDLFLVGGGGGGGGGSTGGNGAGNDGGSGGRTSFDNYIANGGEGAHPQNGIGGAGGSGALLIRIRKNKKSQ